MIQWNQWVIDRLTSVGTGATVWGITCIVGAKFHSHIIIIIAISKISVLQISIKTCSQPLLTHTLIFFCYQTNCLTKLTDRWYEQSLVDRWYMSDLLLASITRCQPHETLAFNACLNSQENVWQIIHDIRTNYRAHLGPIEDLNQRS